jgi:sortase (surface protein transpeptidase)
MVPVRAVLLGALTLVLATVPAGSEAAGRHPTARTDPPLTAPAVDAFRSTRTFEVVAVPVRLRIPAIHVDTAIERLGRQADGTIAVPESPHIAGWYAEGPRPGQPGPAVLLGHVDSVSGPGVFFDLAELSPGTTVNVDRADGSSVGFRVTGTARVPKTSFPTDLVYSPTLEPSLRLVTCGGSFDYRARSYRDNVIVYASPA